MAHIVAGLFEDQVAAERAIDALRGRGIIDDDITSFIVNPPGMHHGLPLGGDEAADKEARGGEQGALKGAGIGGAVGIAAGLVAAPLVGPIGIAAGIGAGAFVGALAGAANSMGDEAKHMPTARPGGVMVAVNTQRSLPDDVVMLLQTHGAKLVEQAEGQWQHGHWLDFDPVSTPGNVAPAASNRNYPT
jgi:hypothetical protein